MDECFAGIKSQVGRQYHHVVHAQVGSLILFDAPDSPNRNTRGVRDLFLGKALRSAAIPECDMVDSHPSDDTLIRMPVAQDEDVDLIVEHALTTAIDGGYPPRSLDAWVAAVRADILRMERDRPGHIKRVVAGLRAREQGKRVTGWREVRGTHSVSHVRDPEGTDRPPWL